MARQRFIWPDIWTDPTVARLEPLAMLLFIGCFSNADDDGRLLGDAAYLKSTVFPYQPLTVEEVEKCRDAMLSQCPTIERYDVQGLTYLAFKRWTAHQKPKYPKPSKLPPPPGFKKRRRPRLSQNPSGNDSGNPSGTPSGNDSGETGPRVGQGRAGLGSKGSTVVRPPNGAADQDQDVKTLIRQSLGTDLERQYEVDAILHQVTGNDLHSRDVLLALAGQLPVGAIADVRARARGHTVKWAVGALQGKVAERTHA